MAVFQLGGLMMVHNVLTAAAREGSRLASLSNTSSSATVITAVQERLLMGGVDPDLVTVSVSPSSLDSLTTGAEVTVTVSGQTSQLVFFWPDHLPSNLTMSAGVTYNRE